MICEIWSIWCIWKGANIKIYFDLTMALVKARHLQFRQSENFYYDKKPKKQTVHVMAFEAG